MNYTESPYNIEAHHLIRGRTYKLTATLSLFIGSSVELCSIYKKEVQNNIQHSFSQVTLILRNRSLTSRKYFISISGAVLRSSVVCLSGDHTRFL
jgi:hypothetical protein